MKKLFLVLLLCVGSLNASFRPVDSGDDRDGDSMSSTCCLCAVVAGAGCAYANPLSLSQNSWLVGAFVTAAVLETERALNGSRKAQLASLKAKKE